MEKVKAWLGSSRNGAISFGFFPAFANRVKLDVVDPYNACPAAERAEYIANLV